MDTIFNSFVVYVAILFLAIVLRYFVAAGLFYFYYYSYKTNVYRKKRLSKRRLKKDQLKQEIFWSIKSSLVFAIVGAATFWLWKQGLTAIYLDISTYAVWYVPVSIILALLIHETYYYWVHRWMHQPKIYRRIHKVHHDSLTPTPWTAFSFHPWEALLEAIILPIILLIVPIHPYVLLFYLLLMTLSSVINHLDIEIYPPRFRKSKIGGLFIGATHHHYHHAEFKTNYGLYFTFWDQWMGTQSKKM